MERGLSGAREMEGGGRILGWVGNVGFVGSEGLGLRGNTGVVPCLHHTGQWGRARNLADPALQEGPVN